MLETHPQNTLLELDSDFKVTRFISRDLQASTIDLDLRREKGFPLDCPPEIKIAGRREPQHTRYLEYSTFYDHRISYQTLEEIILALASKYPCHVNQLQRIVRKVFRQTIETLGIDPDIYFPKDAYYLFRDGMTINNALELVEYPDPPYR